MTPTVSSSKQPLEDKRPRAKAVGADSEDPREPLCADGPRRPRAAPRAARRGGAGRVGVGADDRGLPGVLAPRVLQRGGGLALPVRRGLHRGGLLRARVSGGDRMGGLRDEERHGARGARRVLEHGALRSRERRVRVQGRLHGSRVPAPDASPRRGRVPRRTWSVRRAESATATSGSARARAATFPRAAKSRPARTAQSESAASPASAPTAAFGTRARRNTTSACTRSLSAVGRRRPVGGHSSTSFECPHTTLPTQAASRG